jgi:dynein heavy chain, axonemal
MVTVDEKELRDEYFTVSAQGVVHICPEKGTAIKKANKFDAVPTEFFSLSDWMQQSTMFNVLTSMKYFKHYLIGKVFSSWKGNVRFKMYNRTRQNLAQNLIYARPAFLGSFLDINKTLFEMASAKTYTVPKVTQKSYELEHFMEDQKVERVDRSGCVK